MLPSFTVGLLTRSHEPTEKAEPFRTSGSQSRKKFLTIILVIEFGKRRLPNSITARRMHAHPAITQLLQTNSPPFVKITSRYPTFFKFPFFPT